MRMNQKKRKKEHDAWRPPETQGTKTGSHRAFGD